jgi:hypothetical protein
MQSESNVQVTKEEISAQLLLRRYMPEGRLALKLIQERREENRKESMVNFCLCPRLLAMDIEG